MQAKNGLKPGTGGYTCNPSYSGGRDQEDGGLMPDQTYFETLSQKNPSQKKGLWSGSRNRP
jgi:hypothetical protein